MPEELNARPALGLGGVQKRIGGAAALPDHACLSQCPLSDRKATRPLENAPGLCVTEWTSQAQRSLQIIDIWQTVSIAARVGGAGGQKGNVSNAVASSSIREAAAEQR
ncbi:hypothetical protein PaG_03246 [Moesziomyces aphidis]|uniref:Uncharacterized protein n=1 Tax=Moesziomyces aphidis TaxID=84754 RepID=W3VP95_MOEAP|nr:hypothetical protein PaG_03246 [Moesziomyces aphidis]